MSIEEAIEILEHTYFFALSEMDVDTALEMAIQALKEKEIQPTKGD